MNNPVTPQDPFALAAEQERDERQHRRRQAARTGLLVHAAVFVAIQLLLVVIWYMGDSSTPWFLFPLLGWGAGLLAHAVAARSRT